jgi:hypothetical protein
MTSYSISIIIIQINIIYIVQVYNIMAGGIGTPFQLNPKCVIFALLIMLGYYALPEQNIDIYNYHIPIISTIVILIYTYLYSCKNSNMLVLLLLILILVLSLQYLYWHTKRGLWVVYYSIFFIGYVALAYFDYIMQCEIPLQSGAISFTHLFKPH